MTVQYLSRSLLVRVPWDATPFPETSTPRHSLLDSGLLRGTVQSLHTQYRVSLPSSPPALTSNMPLADAQAAAWLCVPSRLARYVCIGPTRDSAINDTGQFHVVSRSTISVSQGASLAQNPSACAMQGGCRVGSCLCLCLSVPGPLWPKKLSEVKVPVQDTTVQYCTKYLVQYDTFVGR